MASRSKGLKRFKISDGRGGVRVTFTPVVLLSRAETINKILPPGHKNNLSPETGWEKRLSRETADRFDVKKALKDALKARAKISVANKKRPKK